MPTYTYACNSCDHRWDAVCRIADRDAPLAEVCPGCQKPQVVERIMQAPAIGDPAIVGGSKKIPSDFRTRMGQMRKGIPHNNLPDI